MRTRFVAFLVGSLALAVVAGLLLWRAWSTPEGFERAVGLLPATTMRATYTDWSAVREQADGEGLDASSSEREVGAFLDRAFDLDLVSTSALAESAHAMERRYGVSPLQAEWEALGQDETGQVVVLAFGDGTDLGGLEGRLRSLGYAAPADGAGSGGTWDGDADLVAALDPELTPVHYAMAVLPDEGLVLMSDTAEAVSRAVDVARGDTEALAAGPSVDVAGTPVSAVLWAGDFACRDLAMTAADPEDQRVGEQLVQEAGGVSPLAGLVMAAQPDGTIRVGLTFESDDQASADLQPRVDLAAGDAPGQGGSFADRFRVGSGTADGSTVRIDLQPVDGTGFVFSDITTGPVLFATC